MMREKASAMQEQDIVHKNAWIKSYKMLNFFKRHFLIAEKQKM